MATCFSVRWMTNNDVQQVVNYWYACSPEDWERMGIIADQFPTKNELYQIIGESIGVPTPQSKAGYIIWKVNGEAIGFSSFKDIVPFESGGMHLHMWKSGARGKGYGAKLFALSALRFFEAFQVKNIFCEPSSKNPLPNRMLTKIGFPLVKTYIGKSSALSAVTELNRYDVRVDIATAYLEKENILGDV